MRLTQYECNSITQTILAYDKNANIYLFGSRVDDNKKGGDIDLLILSPLLTFQHQIDIKVKLHDLLGEQKIDLVISDDITKPFVQLAIEEGVLL